MIQVQAHGASRGNPGPAAAATVLVFPDGRRMTRSRKVGKTSAESAGWFALLYGAQEARAAKADAIEIRTDNEDLVKQMTGASKPRHAAFRAHLENILALLEGIPSWTVVAVPPDAIPEALAAVGALLEPKVKGTTTRKAKGQEKPKVLMEVVSPLFPEAVGAPLHPPATEAIRKFLAKGGTPRFKDYLKLHSGFDEFSSMRLPDLHRALPENAHADIKAAFPREDDQARACRWLLRGLPVNMAIGKVRADLDQGVTANRNREERDRRMAPGHSSGRP